VCTACGYIELYAPLQLEQPEKQLAEAQPAPAGLEPVIAAA
jgi:hypothetical protein